ncbi:MAG: MXAN_6640 family putative metalloprotease, partial [Chloroflexota bacterium]
TLELTPEQGVVIDLIAVDSDVMDPVLSLNNPDGLEVAFNDDRLPGEVFDSQIIYIPTEAGIYTIVVDNFPDFFGEYELLITYIDAEQATEIIEINNEIPETSTTPEREPDEVYTGQIEEDDDTDEYSLELMAGQGVIAAVFATDERMDTVLSVLDPNGVEFIFNDDRGDYVTFDSQVAFTASEAGEYTLIVDNYPGFAGAYRLEIYYTTPEETALAEQALREILSGEVEQYETENFLIHYTTEGVDAAELDYIEEVADTLEEVFDIQVNQLGWAMPPSDIGQGGDGRIDVYIRNITSAYGYMSTSSPAGDNPNTSAIETSAQAGYMVLDNDYTDYNDPIQAMRATVAHEFHHVVQYGYDGTDFQWYFESTASWMETVTFPEDEEATIYIEDVYNYPEACFGGQGEADPTGLGVYGTWLFFEFMSAELGEEAPILLWENIANDDEWEPLELTLATYDETIPSIVSRYHINNLMRDYILIDSFDNLTVFVEDRIDEGDDWEPEGQGVQELGANFFELDLDDLERGRYEFELRDADDDLEIYVIGIREDDDEADVYMLGEQGTVDLDDYDYAYVMVFNTDYD